VTDDVVVTPDERAIRERIDLIVERTREPGNRLNEALNASRAVAFIRECGLDQPGAGARAFEHLSMVFLFLSKPELVMETMGPFVEAVESFQAARDEAVAALAELDGTADRAAEVEAREVAVAERESAVTEREQEMDAREERIREHFSIGAARG
jgi:Na+-transporting methylmalonyl-CoA/oxaloacetate decarboxylase gamma subunit